MFLNEGLCRRVGLWACLSIRDHVDRFGIGYVCGDCLNTLSGSRKIQFESVQHHFLV